MLSPIKGHALYTHAWVLICTFLAIQTKHQPYLTTSNTTQISARASQAHFQQTQPHPCFIQQPKSSTLSLLFLQDQNIFHISHSISRTPRTPSNHTQSLEQLGNRSSSEEEQASHKTQVIIIFQKTKLLSNSRLLGSRAYRWEGEGERKDLSVCIVLLCKLITED